LLQLTPVQQQHALGNAGTQAGGLWQFLVDGSMSKQWHAGRAAESGLTAAQLASRGFTGPLGILEGERGFFKFLCPDAVPENLLNGATGWRVSEVSYKPWPSPRHTHPAIDAALAAAPDVHADIERVELDTYPIALELCNEPEPTSEHAARFSLKYCVAAALADKHIDFESFEAPARTRNQALASKVSVAATARFRDSFPVAWGAEVRVFLTDGSVIRSKKEHAKGDPGAPMSESEIRKKSVELLQRGQYESPELFVDAILAMADGGPFPSSLIRVALQENA
jgi:2-methylcitrate dehydratase PrpD